MSVPPSSNPPPGGPVYYGQPPGGPSNNNAGCLKAFGITCGVLLLLLVLGGALLVKTWGPLYQQFLKMGQSLVKSQQDGRTIQQAVVVYHAKNGKYPANLTALVADGEISDAGILHSEQDPDPSLGHISWRYRRPAEGAPGSTPLLDLPYNITIAGHTQPAHLVINLDGSQPTQPGMPPSGPPGSSP